MNWTTLVSAAELATALGAGDAEDRGLVLIDCRFALNDPEAGVSAWRTAHLPGAVYAHLDRDLSNHHKPAGEGRHPLPEIGDFLAALVRWGVTPASQVVAYDAGDGAMAAARLWWLLRLLGHERVAVLDGGMAAWQTVAGPLESALPAPAAGHYAGDFDASLIVGVDEVRARLGDAPGWLLDARAPERFRGDVEPIDRVAGHIPGARNRPFVQNLRDGRFKPVPELRAEFAALLAQRAPTEVVLSCGSGVTACHNLLAMEHAGLVGARIYAPSWSGWSSDPANPVATGDA